MQSFDSMNIKCAYTTHHVPLTLIAGYQPFTQAPRIGDLVVAEVLSLGKHSSIEDRNGISSHIFPGDRIVGAFGNRYATDQYEGYVPTAPVAQCDLLSVGGVCGEVVSRHSSMGATTRLRVLGAACTPQGQPLNQRAFTLPATVRHSKAEIILVVGASMNAGKTTTMGTLARAITASGKRVAAAKITGTAAGKDGRYIASCGARPMLDFTDAGFPSTYMLNADELLLLYHSLVAGLHASNPDYIILEIADGIFQRETRMLLERAEFRGGVDHVFFAANDSLSAECGVRCLRSYGLPLRAVTGIVSASPLASREAEDVTRVPCLSIERMLAGELLELLAPTEALSLGSVMFNQKAV